MVRLPLTPGTIRMSSGSAQVGNLPADSVERDAEETLDAQQTSKRRSQLRALPGCSPGAAGAIPRRGQYSETARMDRVVWLRGATGAALRALATTGLDARRIAGNVENFVGGVEVPVGLAPFSAVEKG